MKKSILIILGLIFVCHGWAEEIGPTGPVPPESGTLEDFYKKKIIENSLKKDEQIIVGKPDTGYDNSIINAVKGYEKTGKAWPIIKDDLVIYPYGEMQPVVSCKPLWITTIELEPGEKLYQTVAGDVARWKVAKIVHGTGENMTYHVIIKPMYKADYSTNLIITTNRRIYALIINTDEAKYFPRIKYYYPQDMIQTWVDEKSEQKEQAKKDEVIIPIGNVDITKANFDYIVEGDESIEWKPTQVFDINGHVYIVLPANIEGLESPALVLRDGTGKDNLVNYRVIGEGRNIYMVDKLFKKAAMVIGPAKSREEVIIYRKKYYSEKTKKKSWFGGKTDS